MRIAVPLHVCALLALHAASAAQPLRAGAYQAPVRGEPGDLLLLPGAGYSAGDTVEYQRADSPEHGSVPVLSSALAPHALIVQLPPALQPGRVYALSVRDRDGARSAPIIINDARPLWISPAGVAVSDDRGGLGRYLRVIGRNLDPVPGQQTRVRLTAAQSFTLTARLPDTAPAVLAQFVAQVSLPARLPPGDYRIEVSRDGTSWVELAGQRLRVRPDPPTMREFDLGAGADGACRAGESGDVTGCLQRALQSAARAGGGVVRLGPGAWNLRGAGSGIDVPEHVQIVGAGAGRTTLLQRGFTGAATLILHGDNTVRGIEFRAERPQSTAAPLQPALRLGVPRGSRTISGLTITDNRFDRPGQALADAMVPISDLVIARNEFGARGVALELAGDRARAEPRFAIEDAIIVHNRFAPGSQPDTMASELGAGHRVDFSDNVADGAERRYLDGPPDARGWRAAFFWNLNASHEQVLIAANRATCTGDRRGDGEGIGLDNNGNTFAYDSVRTVSAADAGSVSAEGPLQTQQWGQPVAAERYYPGHWLQIVAGTGMGQVRRIVGLQRTGTRVRWLIEPAWDVVPRAGEARFAVGREFWQVYVVGNDIDNRAPLCAKSNRTAPKAGVIGLWAQAADSVIVGNVQHDSDGILLQNLYSAAHACPDCRGENFFLSHIEVRDNLVDGEYDWSDACSSSGIVLSLGASPDPATPPPTAGFDIDIAHNRIVRADAERGGAITTTPSWYRGPPPYRWPLIAGLIVQHNQLEELDGPRPRACARAPAPRRLGIELAGDGLVQDSVLFANRCRNVTEPLHDTALRTRVVAGPDPDDCAAAR